MNREQLTSLDLGGIQQRDSMLQRLISRRQGLLEDAPGWNIVREHPDIQNSALERADDLVKNIIPDSIGRLGKEREELAVARQEFIQTHAPELLEQARIHRETVDSQQRVVRRLQRDLRGGYTTQDVYEANLANLKTLEAQQHTDPNLSAGYDLFTKLQEPAAQETATIQEETAARKEAGLPKELAPISPSLKRITFKGTEDPLDASNTISKNLERISKIPPEKLSLDETQLLADIEFLKPFTDLNTYKRNLTPQELHLIVTRVKELTQIDETLEASAEPQFPRLAQRIFQVLSEKERGVQSKGRRPKKRGRKTFLDAANEAVAVIRSSRNVATSRYIIRGGHGGVYEVALHLAGAELYDQRIKTPEQINRESYQENKELIRAWQETAKPVLDELRGEPGTGMKMHELDEALAYLNTATFPAIQHAMRTQLRLGGIINQLNNILTDSKRQHTQETAEVTTGLVTGDQIPNLLPMLGRITSMHVHKYNPELTAAAKAAEAEKIPAGERAERQVQLLQDRKFLHAYTQTDAYMEIYTPDELHEFAQRLRLFKQKNRPDFNGLEDDLLSLVESQYDLGHMDRPVSLVGARQRVEDDAEGRRGMQWLTLVEMAEQAHEHIRSRITGGERTRYFFTVSDPHPHMYPDLTAVYQVTADLFARDVIGRRSAAVDGVRQETYVVNCQIINDWYAQVSGILDQLAGNPRTRPLCIQINRLIEIMTLRLTHGQSSGDNKDYRLDPAGAIGLQQKIGYLVEDIRTVSERKIVQEEIVPLE